jgi:hypothetical protein
MKKERYNIPMRKPCSAFIDAYNSMGAHFNGLRKMMPESFSFLRMQPVPPLLDHLSFKIGNQIFFVYMDPLDQSVEPVSNLGAMIDFAENSAAIPCLMLMKRTSLGWEPATSGWGLVDARTGKPVNPPDLVTDELIEMSDWELHDFAVQVVRNTLAEQEDINVTSYCSNPGIDPSVWFLDSETGEEGYVVVHGARYPNLEAAPPEDPESLIEHCAFRTRNAFFASVGAANNEDPFDPDALTNGNFLPLYRGGGMVVRYQGLVPLIQTNWQ